ncbi:MAG: hypothetical protein GXP62_16095 [Oligoflexia bacterium]|nr:hypothetical protein [Oligoflexia bacterium]
MADHPKTPPAPAVLDDSTTDTLSPGAGVQNSSAPSTDAASAAPQEPAESREDFLLREEATVGDTALALGLNKGLRALARAARSFLLYDPSNEAIRVFLTAYRTDMLGAIQAVMESGQFGSGVELFIRPFEMVWAGETVYLERDRERSLAFRMFRDGVRRLTLRGDVTWDELLRLLQIMSIRFTGVRQQEDDIVTLLWKAGFKGIEIVAVEGFVPEDEEVGDDEAVVDQVAGQGEERGRRQSARGGRSADARTAASFVDAPADFDLPIAPLLPVGRVIPVAVDQDELLALQLEATSHTLPEQCVRLAHEMLSLVADPRDPTDWPDIRYLLDEVRDFLLAEGQLQPLIDLVTAMEDMRTGDSTHLDDALRAFVDGRALVRIVRSIPAAHTRPPPDLLWLLDHLPGDHLAHALDILASERSVGARRIARQLVEHFVDADPDLVLARIQGGDPAVAADLLRAFCVAVPARTLEAIGAAVSRGDADLSFEALRVLDRAAVSPEVLDLLLQLLESEVEEVRLRSLEQITHRNARTLFQAVQDHLAKASHQRMSPKEASAFGTTLVSLDQARAHRLLSEWIRPKSLFKRIFQDPIGHKWLQWAAVSGVAQVPGDEPEKLIRWLAERAGSDLADHCVRTLARRRREMANA